MKIGALHLTNVRKFTGKRASITGIGDGITVLSEANEFGKSTFFDAIHALFFEKYSATSKAVKSLQPYAGGAVEVAADIITDQGGFRVEKRFLARKSAKVIRLADNATVAQDDEAERWIAAVLGIAAEGPAGILWVRQGLVGLEPDTAREKTQAMETRRDILSSVAGEIDAMTGGRRMDRVMRAVAEALSAIATKTGRKTGAWKEAADDVAVLEVELADVTAQADTLAAALIARKQAEVILARLDNPEAKIRREAALAAAQAGLEAARAHAGLVAAAGQERDLAALRATAARSDLDGFLAALDGLNRASDVMARIRTQAAQANEDVARCKRLCEGTEVRHAAAAATLGTARKALDAARLQAVARKARDDASSLGAQIVKAEAARGARDAALAAVKASGATQDWLQRVEAAAADFAKHSAAVTAASATLSVTYSGAVRVVMNGAEVVADAPVVLDGTAVVDLPGIGQMHLTAQTAGPEGKARLAAAEAKLGALLAQVGVDTLQGARGAAAARAQAQTEADRAQSVLDAIAPNGVQALNAAKAEADLAAQGADDAPITAATVLQAQVLQAEQAAEDARTSKARAEGDHQTARETAIKLQAGAEAAQADLDRAMTAAGPAEAHADRRATLLRQQAQAEAALAQSEAAVQTLIADAPDLATARAELDRAETAVKSVQTERAQNGERLAALSSEIRTLAGHGIEERRDDLAGQLDTARLREARFADQAAALTRLQSALEAERDAARDMYFGPVQEELKPLLSILHRDAALQFDSDSLLPTGLTRADTDEQLDDLSGGTREQIAILTRLAFARLFARQGRHMPIILDDALVYSDDDRIIKMFTALTRVAKDQQIIVFSCRQLAFQDLGGARPAFGVVEV